ncbi:unnamed protein product [Prorocentrum cordatum]|uniref:Uncharacterized protein n=1 Tax=Prorocentrum cordatum TaxID=2364126 RepID=A0ABN9YFC9_9DINO|nr:unnamed protein product [Polarella glacialis]
MSYKLLSSLEKRASEMLESGNIPDDFPMIMKHAQDLRSQLALEEKRAPADSAAAPQQPPQSAQQQDVLLQEIRKRAETRHVTIDGFREYMLAENVSDDSFTEGHAMGMDYLFFLLDIDATNYSPIGVAQALHYQKILEQLTRLHIMNPIFSWTRKMMNALKHAVSFMLHECDRDEWGPTSRALNLLKSTAVETALKACAARRKEATQARKELDEAHLENYMSLDEARATLTESAIDLRAVRRIREGKESMTFFFWQRVASVAMAWQMVIPGTFGGSGELNGSCENKVLESKAVGYDYVIVNRDGLLLAALLPPLDGSNCDPETKRFIRPALAHMKGAGMYQLLGTDGGIYCPRRTFPRTSLQRKWVTSAVRKDENQEKCQRVVADFLAHGMGAAEGNYALAGPKVQAFNGKCITKALFGDPVEWPSDDQLLNDETVDEAIDRLQNKCGRAFQARGRPSAERRAADPVAPASHEGAARCVRARPRISKQRHSGAARAREPCCSAAHASGGSSARDLPPSRRSHCGAPSAREACRSAARASGGSGARDAPPSRQRARGAARARDAPCNAARASGGAEGARHDAATPPAAERAEGVLASVSEEDASTAEHRRIRETEPGPRAAVGDSAGARGFTRQDADDGTASPNPPWATGSSSCAASPLRLAETGRCGALLGGAMPDAIAEGPLAKARGSAGPGAAAEEHVVPSDSGDDDAPRYIERFTAPAPPRCPGAQRPPSLREAERKLEQLLDEADGIPPIGANKRGRGEPEDDARKRQRAADVSEGAPASAGEQKPLTVCREDQEVLWKYTAGQRNGKYGSLLDCEMICLVSECRTIYGYDTTMHPEKPVQLMTMSKGKSEEDQAKNFYRQFLQLAEGSTD